MDNSNEGLIIDSELLPITDAVLGIFSVLDTRTPADTEVDYKRLYYFIFNGISDILESEHDTKDALKILQCAAEELYMRMT